MKAQFAGIRRDEQCAVVSDALRGAIQSLIADGTYKAILDKWNVGAGAIPTSQVNPTA